MTQLTPWEVAGADVQVATAIDPQRLVKELAHKSLTKRAQAAWLMASLKEPPSGALEAIAARIKRERSIPFKANLCLALGALEARAGTRANLELLENLSGDVDDFNPKKPPDELRTAAIIGIAWMAPMWLSSGMLTWLQSHPSLTVDAEGCPWLEGDLGKLAALTLPTVEPLNHEQAVSTLREMITAHPKQPRPRPPNFPEAAWDSTPAWPAPVNWLLQRLGSRVYASLGERKEDEPLLEELTAHQVAFARFGIEQGLFIGHARAGLDFQTNRINTWRRYLGMDAPGPLDREIEVEYQGELRSFPIWKWFRLLNRQQLDPEPLRAVLSGFPQEDLIALAHDVAALSYGVPGEGSYVSSHRAKLLALLLSKEAPEAEAALAALRPFVS